jgi:hypothetical protein
LLERSNDWKLPDPGAVVKQLVDPSKWFVWAHWGGRGEDPPPTTDGRFLLVGYDEAGRPLWAGPMDTLPRITYR